MGINNGEREKEIIKPRIVQEKDNREEQISDRIGTVNRQDWRAE